MKVVSEELRDELKKLKEELRELKEHMKEERGRQRRPEGIYIDVGERVQDYVGDIMEGVGDATDIVEGVVEGIQGELEKSIFVGPRGRHIRIRGPSLKTRKHGRVREREDKPVDFDRTAKVISALGQEHRLRILSGLMSGGKYVNELQGMLPEIATSTLSAHLSVLEEAGLVIQERVRGRYLITIPGRSAYKMARRVNRFLERKAQP
jgi:DNA-binding HxlR family transcriptional regulator